MKSITAARLALAYDKAPRVSPAGFTGASLLRTYIAHSWQTLIADGWRIVPIDDDKFLPCLRTCELTRALPVLDRFHHHPVLSDRENYRFRAVHDIYGHLPAHAYGYSLEDEVAAFRAQARHFERYYFDIRHGQPARATFAPLPRRPRRRHLSPLRADAALSLLFTEIVGQAAYYADRGEFPPQKCFAFAGDGDWR